MASNAPAAVKAEAKILFQDYFRSVGPRTYAAQVKAAGNGNHFIVLTEGRRDEKTGDVRKTKLFVFSEDFEAFFAMFNKAADFVRRNPMSAEVVERRKRYWTKQRGRQHADAK